MYGARVRTCMIVTIAAFAGLLAASSMVVASPMSDVADGVNDALFGGVNLFAAQAVLTGAVMIAVGLALSMLGLDQVATFIVLFAVLAMLTAIGWASPMLLLVAAMLVVALFVQKVTGYFTGAGGGDRTVIGGSSGAGKKK